MCFSTVTQSVFLGARSGTCSSCRLFNSVFLFACRFRSSCWRGGRGHPYVIVGFVLSRVVSYELAVVGLTVGAFVFMLLSSLYARRAFNRLDYYYYSAY